MKPITLFQDVVDESSTEEEDSWIDEPPENFTIHDGHGELPPLEDEDSSEEKEMLESTYGQLQKLTLEKLDKECEASSKMEEDIFQDDRQSEEEVEELPSNRGPFLYRAYRVEADIDLSDDTSSVKEDEKIIVYKQGMMLHSGRSETVELWHSPNIRSLSKNSLLKAMCGLLNTKKKGVLCLGVDGSGMVCGIPLHRIQRDEIRLSLDKFTSYQIIPPLLPNNVEVNFIEVVKDVKTADTDLKLWVIEIHLFPSTLEIYTLADGQCFIRQKTQTYEANFLDVRRAAIVQAIKYFKPLCELVEKETNMLEKEAAKHLSKLSETKKE